MNAIDIARTPDRELLEILGITGVTMDLQELFGFAKNRVREPEASYMAAQKKLAAAKELYARALASQMAEKVCLNTPRLCRDFLVSKLGPLDHEEFWCLWLDSQHSLILAEGLFRGSANEANVYIREVAKRALEVNATGLIIAHNHPSGVTEASNPDKEVTRLIRKTLDLINVRLLDHIIVAGTATSSFAEKGLLNTL